MKRLVIPVSADQHQRIKLRAIDNHQTIRAMVLSALNQAGYLPCEVKKETHEDPKSR